MKTCTITFRKRYQPGSNEELPGEGVIMDKVKRRDMSLYVVVDNNDNIFLVDPIDIIKLISLPCNQNENHK